MTKQDLIIEEEYTRVLIIVALNALKTCETLSTGRQQFNAVKVANAISMLETHIKKE